MTKTLAMKIAKYIHMVRRRFGLRCFLFVSLFFNLQAYFLIGYSYGRVEFISHSAKGNDECTITPD
jgi:hypothetical protein